MPNTYIDKDRFLSLLDQFIYDVPFEMKIMDRLLANIPPTVVPTIIEEFYFKYVHKGEYYRLQHAILKDDLHYRVGYLEVKKFLQERSLEMSPAQFNFFTPKILEAVCKEKRIIAGYLISKEERT